MHNSALRQNKYYVDSLSGNPERGLRQKVRSCEYLSLASAGYINDSRTKTIIVGIVFFSIIIFFLIPYLPSRVIFYTKPATTTNSQTPQDMIDSMSVEPIQSIAFSEQASAGFPIRLKVPKINVDVTVEYVGLASDGAMDTPKSPDDVVWFELGQRPGENGSAVIAGHYGWGNGKASVFDNLYKLHKGDKLYIEDDKGIAVSFVVRESRRYDPEADASNVFNSNDGKSHLNLITCDGIWDGAKKSYSKRLVVFADIVD
jgi:LPXTG-site transpeptidase (sortase) family protein